MCPVKRKGVAGLNFGRVYPLGSLKAASALKIESAALNQPAASTMLKSPIVKTVLTIVAVIAVINLLKPTIYKVPVVGPLIAGN